MLPINIITIRTIVYARIDFESSAEIWKYVENHLKKLFLQNHLVDNSSKNYFSKALQIKSYKTLRNTSLHFKQARWRVIS